MSCIHTIQLDASLSLAAMYRPANPAGCLLSIMYNSRSPIHTLSTGNCTTGLTTDC